MQKKRKEKEKVAHLFLGTTPKSSFFFFFFFFDPHHGLANDLAKVLPTPSEAEPH